MSGEEMTGREWLCLSKKRQVVSGDVGQRKDRKRSGAVWQKREEKTVMMSGPGKEKTGRELNAMSGEEKKKTVAK